MRRTTLLAILLAACTDANAPAEFPEPTAGSTGGGSSSSTGPPPVPETILEGTFDLELKDSITLEFVQTGAAVSVAVTVNEGFGVVPAGETLQGVARVDELPEAGATFYTARLAAPPQAGPCGDQPISLGLSLHKDDDSPVYMGGLTPYCGEAQWHGVPIIEPLRISGRL